MSHWECGVCGYIHKEGSLPEKCPVCEAPGNMFKEVVAAQESSAPLQPTPKRWRCTVCGYIHAGDAPPEICPVCGAAKNMFVELDADGKPLGSPASTLEGATAPTLSGSGSKEPVSFLNRIGDLVLKLHLHPITVHFPNGILPVVVTFLGLAVYFKIASLELAAYFNLIFVLLMLPVVLLTGYLEWQKRYKGIKSALFITKIVCSLIVLASTNVLVFWRLLDPGVASQGSPYQLVYLGIAGAMLAAAGIAGHLGGKLVFGTRK